MLTPSLAHQFSKLYTAIREQMCQEDTYAQLNQFRDVWNCQQQEFELYLEDQWNEPIPGETHFEYWLRSRQTFHEVGPLGYDVYFNLRDARGVWHLGDYQSSTWLLLPEKASWVVDVTGRTYITLSHVCQFLETHHPPLI